MTSERFVVLGLAQVRAPWFREVAQWAHSAVVPLEFLKAVSIDEVRVRLRSGRSFSALLVDETVHGLDRDLIDLALSNGCAVVLVGEGRTSGRSDLGVSARLAPLFSRDELVHVLRQVAAPVSTVPASNRTPGEIARSQPEGYRGHLVAVTGSGGTGRSTVAMALAQALAADPRHAGLVCLADLALQADLAMLHDAGDVVPGVVELVEACRSGTPTIEQVRQLTWLAPERGYHLLLGLRRHRDWTSLRPRSIDAAIDGLRRSFRLLVADIDSDLEGERATGSFDIEERNALARRTVDAASLVCVVGSPELQGVRGMLRVTRELLDHGVPGGSILPVVNRSPRGPRARSEITRAFGELLAGAIGDDHGVPSPVYVALRRRLADAVRDGTRLPDDWLTAVSRPVSSLLDHRGDSSSPDLLEASPVPVAPGSLGRWTSGGEDD